MKGKIVKNYLYNIVIVFTNIVFPILLFPYASRVLTPEYYGKYSYAISIASYFVAIANLGVQAYGMRELSKVRNDEKIKLKTKFSELFILTIISSLISSIIYLILIFNVTSIYLEKKLFIAVGITIFLSFMNLDYLFVALENHKRRTLRLVVTRGISLIFLFTLVREPKDYIVFACVIILPEVFVKVVDLIYIKEYITLKINFDNVKKHLYPMLIIFFSILSQTVYMNVDSTMLGAMKDELSVGYYSVAIKMSKIIIPLVGSLGIVLSPRIIENIKNNNKILIYKDMNLYLSFILFITFPATFLMGLLAKEMIVMLSGENYIISVLPMRVMLPIVIFISISGFVASQVLIPTNNEKKVLKVSIMGLISNLSLNLFLIPKYGMLGAGIATVISEFLVSIFRITELKKIFPDYEILDKEKRIYIMSSIVAFVVSIIFKKYVEIENIYLSFILISCIYGIIYIGILIFKKEYFIVQGIQFIKNKFLKENKV
ncbi:MAG: flippase [Fusobacteriaceae bacterium]